MYVGAARARRYLPVVQRASALWVSVDWRAAPIHIVHDWGQAGEDQRSYPRSATIARRDNHPFCIRYATWMLQK